MKKQTNDCKIILPTNFLCVGSNILVAIGLGFLMLFTSTCKKSIVGEEFLGYWELEKYTINGYDTTAYIKADSNCYGYTRFIFVEEKELNRILQSGFYSVGLNFHC